MDAVKKYLSKIGSKGGKAGIGQKKVRSPEQYREMALKSAEARRAKKAKRK